MEVVDAVQVAHVWRLVLVVLVLAGYRLGVVVVGLGEGGGGQDQVLAAAHWVARVHAVLALAADVVLVVVLLHFGLKKM